jgi:hypothetical protein
MSSESGVYVGFADGASQNTESIYSTYWVIFMPTAQLVSFGGVCLGEETNNVSKYSVVIELLCDSLSYGIYHLHVHLDAQLVLS